MKKIIVCFGVSCFIGFAIWFFFKTDYDIKSYNLKGCSNADLTVIIYSNIGERGIIFYKGRSQKIPVENFVKNNQMSGFDSVFECIVTCENDTIVINYHDGYFDPSCTSADIETRRVNTRKYLSMRNDTVGTIIRIF